MGSLAAVFFDMDGLLVDTEPIWTVAEQEAAARLGGTFTPAMKRAMIGHGIDTAVPIMVEMLGQPPAAVADTARFLLRRSAELFREPGAIVAQPGAVELLGALHAGGVPTALVSSSFRDLMDPVLDVIGRELFAVTVAGDEVSRRKPDPEPYLVAARHLGADPRSCVVLEDSPSGAQAGVAAACATVMVPSMPDLLDLTTPAAADRVDTPAAAAADLRAARASDVDVARRDAGRAPLPEGLAAVVASLHEVSPRLLEELVAARRTRA
ncbi:Haloacid dehalogenase superfamily protein, subfamily IA, variant 3 with third motif having DD or ED [Frankia canadensis]|uniref:Haloacid dehalogenase superfamily protein, subfamily IA, variant 3 with third motif having DD or ED n=1 Tax=Frankia canadensis TaxID=1836972 RepID=A0A2I2KRX3_9ACTN|nr:HAD family phosphatase [Frankia canadensis]SNQ48399.1 Haloacid dehalogenase superfamily protein, subfamily IA, variant 3 with third motif having DD or ED [Frankia canadensis]SOU55689.1 Haloacid dehalogenase superfamily protein, subfamily IA, variant 3 with third motif having DD or ED [Frankia canadensis]